MAEIMEGSVAVEVSKAETVDVDMGKTTEEDVTKGLKRKLEEEAAEPKLNGTSDEKEKDTNGYETKNGHKNGNGVSEAVEVKESPVKKVKTDEEEKSEEKTEEPAAEIEKPVELTTEIEKVVEETKPEETVVDGVKATEVETVETAAETVTEEVKVAADAETVEEEKEEASE